MNTALRKLALRLACGHPADREWLLGQLTPAERQQMEALLEDISQLGLTADPAITLAVMQDAEPDDLPEADQIALLNVTADPFWLGLGLQTLTAKARVPYLDVRYGDKSSLLRWHNTFTSEALPPALLRHLKTHLEARDSTHASV